MRAIILLVLLLTAGAASAQFLPEPKGGQTVYVVRPGDTLWNITERFFDNPLLWPRLWELNAFIDNPRLIYPGDVIALKWRPNVPVVKIEPQMKERGIVTPPPPPPVYFYSRGGSEGFISPDQWEHMGSVISSEPPKILLGEGDEVYVNVGAGDDVVKGDEFTVFRTGKEVYHPLSGKKVGYKVAILGELEIDDVVAKHMSSAKITRSFREITRGARIRPVETFVKEVVMRKSEEGGLGVVVETLNNTELQGGEDIFYIDMGKDRNIVPGNLLSVYTSPRKAYDPDRNKMVTVPGAYIGSAIALSVNEHTATCVVMKSSRQIEKGDLVSIEVDI